jgi:recombination protein RecR
VRRCERCGNWAEVDQQGRACCTICSDSRRDPALLCVVARVQDLLAIERSGAMRGRYFVLGRLLSPLDGVGPEELPLDELRRRIEQDGVREVIVATPLSVEGEATALLLARELGGLGIRVSRIASGVPHGGDLEYADQITLGRAIDGRHTLDG